MMEPELLDEELIARYLLGELSEAEQRRLEEQAFASKDYALQVQAVEKDLIDEYARGELSSTRRQAFEQRFRASENRRRQIGFARALKEIAAERPALAATVESTAGALWWQSTLAFWRGSNLAVRFSFAAVALIVIVGGVWLWRGNRSSTSEQAHTKPSPEATPPPQNSETPQAANNQSAQNGASPPPVPNGSATPGPQTPLIASLLLLPGTTRSSESTPQLVIRTATTEAQLRVGIGAGEPYELFRVELKTATGKPVASQSNLVGQPARDGKLIVWDISASRLNPGEYELTLSGITEQSKAETIGYYYFKVLKKN